MPTIQCHNFHLSPRELLKAEAAVSELHELYADDVDGPMFSGFDELNSLLKTAAEKRLAARFQIDLFPGVTVIWQWLGEGAAVAYQKIHGHVEMAYLMLAGLNREKDAEALCKFGKIIGRKISGDAVFSDRPGSLLISFVSERVDTDCFVSGIILFAGFAEVCDIE